MRGQAARFWVEGTAFAGWIKPTVTIAKETAAFGEDPHIPTADVRDIIVEAVSSSDGRHS